MSTIKPGRTVSPEEHDARVKLAKAMWIVDLGDAKPKDGKEAQAAFDAVKKDWIGNAFKVKKTLLRMGYELNKIPEVRR